MSSPGKTDLPESLGFTPVGEWILFKLKVIYHRNAQNQWVHNCSNRSQSNRLYAVRLLSACLQPCPAVYIRGHRPPAAQLNSFHSAIYTYAQFGITLALSMKQSLYRTCTGVCMHSVVLWPLLTLAASAIAFVPTIADSGHRSLLYWLIIPPLVAGVLAACSQCGAS